MGKVRLKCIGVILLVVTLLASSAWAASISGTVQNNSGKSGRIYLTVSDQYGGSNNIGTSIPSAGAFTINGVQPGNQYSIRAFVDTKGTGIQHANDPSGTSVGVTASSGNVSVGTFAVSTPSTVAAQAPQVTVYRGSGGNFVIWDGPQDGNGLPIADKYTISWSTSSSGSPVAGTKDVGSGDKDFFAHSGGTSTHYYQVTAVVGATTASSGWIPVPAAAGTGSVTGKVYFPGVNATGPLFVVLVDESTNPPNFSVAAVASPVSGGSYLISNVPAGTYRVYPFLDLNDSGTFNVGDVGNLDNDFAPMVTVSSSPVTAPGLTLTAMNAVTALTTQHSKGDSYDGYYINLKVTPMMKQAVNVQITSGPQITTPVDVAFGAWGNTNFQASFNVGRPTVGDTYQVKVTYYDNTFETVPAAVTAVLDGFATPLAPVGFIPYIAIPIFSWTTPSPAPLAYIYSLWVNESNNYSGSIWDAWGLPSSQTSIIYNSDGRANQSTLTDGTTYNWNVTVTDINGNQAQSQATFTPTSAPAISGFSPPGGLSGTTVTITGLNFDPNPASNIVLFRGVPATVSAATSTSLTVTVPSGATTGKIQVNTVVSAKDFVVASPIHISGVIQTSAGVAIAGARVEKSDDQATYTTTAADGSFNLNWLFPNQWVGLKITTSGYVPTYTTNYYLVDNLDLTQYPSHLYTQAELAGWGVTAGKGAIVGQVLNTSTIPYSPVGGVLVTAQSLQNSGAFYPPTYYNGASLGGTSSTYANGLFIVPNVNDNDWVNINASKSSWYFQYSNFNGGFSFNAHANSVTEGGIFGSAQSPYISDFSPVGGLAGTVVTINGVFNPNPLSNAVNFNGFPAVPSAASGTQLTVTVPPGATTGRIQVSTGGNFYVSTTDFIIAAPITFTSVVQNTANAAVAGALIEQPFSTNNQTTTSAANGSFTLPGLFAGYDFSIRLSKSGFVPIYSKIMRSGVSLDRSDSPFHLYTAAEFAGMGVTPGKGVIIAKVIVTGGSATPIAGAVVTAQSSKNPGYFYPVKYSSDGITFGGSSTYANGRFYIFDVDDLDNVTLVVTKTGWNFNPANFNTHADSIHQGSIAGTAQPPNITNLSPTGGKVGSSVTIYGNSFGLTPAENTVKFNGTTAIVTGASAMALTVTVPSGATTGPISVTTAGGTTNSGNNFTMSNTLSTSVAGSGGALGTVTSVPSGISCRTTGCTTDFVQGTTVELVATADAGSILSAWGGACTGTGVCSFSMSADKAVTATFALLQYIKNGTNYYPLLQNAFDGAATGNTIQAQAQVFTDTGLEFNRPLTQVKFKGGYDSSFLTNIGFTTLDGRLNIQGGTLRVEKLKIK